MKKLLLLLLAASASAQPVTPSRGTNVLATSSIFANQVFVDGVSGTDGGTGDITQPYASISYAFKYASKDTTINVLRGMFSAQNLYITQNSCHSIYLQSGVIIQNNQDSFMYIDNLTNATVTIDGRGTLVGQIAYMGNYGPVNGLTLNVTAATINTGNIIPFKNAGTGNRVDNSSFFITADTITATGNLITMVNSMTNTYFNLTAKQSIAVGPPNGAIALLPPQNTFEFTAPSVTMSGNAIAPYNNYMRWIFNRCYLTMPTGTTYTNFTMIMNMVRIKSGGPSATQAGSVFGTTNAWY